MKCPLLTTSPLNGMLALFLMSIIIGPSLTDLSILADDSIQAKNIESVIQLSRQYLAEQEAKRAFTITLFLIAPNGDPVRNAKVKVLGSSIMPDGKFISPTTGGFPSVTTGNSSGKISLTTEHPPTRSASVEITASGYAPMRKSNLNTGSSYILRMLPGVTVSGRIVQNGKGLNGIEMVLESITREEALFGKTKPRSVVKTTTDEDGAFHFAELSPNEEHLLFGNGPSFRNVGYLPDVKLPSRADNTTVNLGDLEVLPGFSISGKLFMKDSSLLPENVSLRISTKRDVNGRFIEVNPDGRFHVKGLPPGPCQIRIAKANHRIVPNRNNATLQDFEEVRLDGDVKDLELLIETVPENERVPQ